MRNETECMFSSFRGVSEKKRLEDTQRALISRSMNRYADIRSFSRWKSVTSLSSFLGTSDGTCTETSVTDVGKRKPCGYLTLLDISVLDGFSVPESSILPDREVVPNSFHQQYHVSRWRSFVKRTPKWILKMGIEGLNKQRNQSRIKMTKKGNDEENLKSNGSSDSWLQQGKHDKESKAYNNSNVQESASENNIGEKDGSEKNEIIEQEDEIGVCTKEWRDWSLQLNGNGKFMITGKMDKNVITVSRDVSFCKRIDARTLKLNDGSVYKLVGMADHFTNLPCYVRNKFQCGFPEDWKEVKLMWEKYIKQGSPHDFSWTQERISGLIEKSAVQKNKTQSEISSPIKERGGAEFPPHVLNSVVQSLAANQSQLTAVKSVAESESCYSVEEEHGKQSGDEESEVFFEHLNSTVVQECGKQPVDATEVCVKQPSSTTVQEHSSQSDVKEVKVYLTRLSSTVVQEYTKQSDAKEMEVCSKRPSSTNVQEYTMHSDAKEMEVCSKQPSSTRVQEYTKQSNVKEMEVYSKWPCSTRVQLCGKQSNDMAVELLDQSNTIAITKKTSLSCAPVNTTLKDDEASTLLNPLVLHRWTPVLIEPSSLKLTGYLQSTCSPDVFIATDTVAVRKGVDCLQCCDGTVYKLQGPLADPEHDIPSPIQELLHQGLPRNWKLVIQHWNRLLAQVRKKGKEIELREEPAQLTTTVTRQVKHVKSSKYAAKSDESVTETVQPTSAIISHAQHKNIESSASVIGKDGVNKGTAMKPTYRSGSLIPLEELKGQGIIHTSSRGRIIVPPVRYWLGERFMQQNNQPTFFSPYPGVTEVVINQSVDRVKVGKKRKRSEYEVRTLAVSRRRHIDRPVTSHESKNKLKTPREEGEVLSNTKQSGVEWKANLQTNQAGGTPDVMHITRNQKRRVLKQKESNVQIRDSDETLSDATISEAIENRRILNKREHKFKKPGSLASKSVFASWSLKKGERQSKKSSLLTKKHGGLNNGKDFKGETSKQKRDFSPQLCICDSEEDLLDGYGDDMLAELPTNTDFKAFRAYSPLSVGSATPPTKYFNSMLCMEDTEAQTLSPVSPPWPRQRRKEIDRFIKRQQKIVEKNVKQPPLLKPTVVKSADKLKTANDHVNAVFSVKFNVVEDKASSFDEDDLSSSYISTEDYVS